VVSQETRGEKLMILEEISKTIGVHKRKKLVRKWGRVLDTAS